MSLAPVSVIMTRISVATVKSPIAVFKPSIAAHGQLDARFGSTMHTQERVAAGAPGFVGYFHNGMRSADVLARLESVVSNG